MSGVSQNGRKNGSHEPDLSLNKKILYQLDRKSVSTSGNGEFL